MDAHHQEQIHSHIQDLTIQHRELDKAIKQTRSETSFNQIHLQRLKKQKLALRDEISRLEALLIPNIIA